MSEKKNPFNINASALGTQWRFYAIFTDVIYLIAGAHEWVACVSVGVGGGGWESAPSQSNLQQCVIPTSCFMSRN